jgi:hypothetical protein
MPTVTIHIAGRGTRLADGTLSLAGHMWIGLENGSAIHSYGFGPDRAHEGQPFGPGRFYDNDHETYTGSHYRKRITISIRQYEAMREFGREPARYGFASYYNGFTNSCVHFAWKMLEHGGLNATHYQGDVWPTNNIDHADTLGMPARRVTDAPSRAGTGSRIRQWLRPFTHWWVIRVVVGLIRAAVSRPWPGGALGRASA